MPTKTEEKRELEFLNEAPKIQYLIDKHLKEATMFLKGFDPPYKVKIVNFNAPDLLTVHLGEYEPDEGQRLLLFRILGRYMHIECSVIKHKEGSLFDLQIQRVAIAKKNRETLRIPVRSGEVFISNIRTSKHSIDANLFHIPTTVKVNFGSTEQELKNSYDFIKIDVFKERGSILDEIKKSKKCLFVANTEDPKSYEAPTEEGFIDYADYLDEDLQKKINEYRNQKVKSEIIVPVIYRTHDESPIPLGYIQVQSKSGYFTIENVEELKKIADRMVERIRDSNTVLVQERQRVINISRGGLKVAIEHEDLKRYLERMNGFTFDLFFRGQAPITIYGRIRASYIDRSHDLILGIQISGNSARKNEMKRFLSNIERLETALRAEIAKRKGLSGK